MSRTPPESSRRVAGDTPEHVVVIVGPTATGKSKMAVSVAREFDGEIVSADAMQVYRGMDVGTAKVGREARRQVRHHCLDLVDPTTHFSAGDWALEARAAIARIRRRGRLPIVAGGSGFYIRALIDGLAELPRQDPRWRAALEAVERRRGRAYLFAMLLALDRECADRVGPNDRQRILRALEVTLRSGRPFSSILEEQRWTPAPYETVWVGLSRPRAHLRQRIAGRVEAMLEAGWLDEVRRLRAAGVPRDCTAMRAIGYRELAACLEGEISLRVAREAIIAATRRYAKRQLTWFKHQTPAIWFELKGYPDREPEWEDRVVAFLSDRLGAALLPGRRTEGD